MKLHSLYSGVCKSRQQAAEKAAPAAAAPVPPNERAHALKCTCNTSLSESPDAAPRPPAADTLVSEMTRRAGDCQQPPL